MGAAGVGLQVSLVAFQKPGRRGTGPLRSRHEYDLTPARGAADEHPGPVDRGSSRTGLQDLHFGVVDMDFEPRAQVSGHRRMDGSQEVGHAHQPAAQRAARQRITQLREGLRHPVQRQVQVVFVAGDLGQGRLVRQPLPQDFGRTVRGHDPGFSGGIGVDDDLAFVDRDHELRRNKTQLLAGLPGEFLMAAFRIVAGQFVEVHPVELLFPRQVRRRGFAPALGLRA